MGLTDDEREAQENEMFAAHVAHEIAKDDFAGLTPNVVIPIRDMSRGVTFFPMLSELRH